MFSTQQQDEEEQSLQQEEVAQNIYGLGSFESTDSSSFEREPNKKPSTLLGKFARSVQDSWKQFSQGFVEVSHKTALKYPSLLFFGDSLTEYSQHVSSSEGIGWGALLTNEYSTKAEVIIRGFAGYNTRWALYMLPKVLQAIDLSCLKLVVIFLGANDCVLPDSPQHVSIEEYASNLFKMIKVVRNKQSQVARAELLLVTPPPFVEELWEEDCRQKNKPVLRKASRVKDYAEACKRVAVEAQVPCLDLWTSIQQQIQWQTFFTDGLHFSEKGNEYVFEQLKTVISDNFPNLTAERMTAVFPHWSKSIL
ncbi:Isoamyl acetate-hydrolyzing esterase 1 [Galdieria sulphuraria]|nr:Isoamyl acetate-hydrolyzing esterase 1 [Galdieria sulphuraria]